MKNPNCINYPMSYLLRWHLQQCGVLWFYCCIKSVESETHVAEQIKKPFRKKKKISFENPTNLVMFLHFIEIFQSQTALF